MADSSSVHKAGSEPDQTTALPGESAPSGDGADSSTPSLTDLSKTQPTPDTISNADNLTGHKLGEFHLLRKLGQGGMADVYLAEQASLNRQVAIKILHEDLRSDDVHLKRFVQEAKAAGGLHHPNIVQVFAIGEENGTNYIAQEYVQGWNLREYLNRNGPPDAPTAIAIMRQVASALQAAAEAGIVHRDIKPENILINRKGEAKVTDFGLAQLSQAGEGVNLTQVGVTMGTPLYMSPEQVNGKKLDQRSDIYSFGVTCYHMLAGQPPFHGETAMSVAVQHINGKPQPLTERRSDLPPALCQLVHKMMAKEPDDRYPNAQTVLEDLRKIAKALQEQPDGAADLSLSQFGMPTISPAKTTAALRTRFLQWCRNHQTTAFVLTAFCVGTVAAGIGWTMRPADPFDARSVTNGTAQGIQIHKKVGDQYYQALIDVDNEASWRAVIDNFPDDITYTPKAMIQLAFLLLDNGRYNEADELFTRIAQLGENDNFLKAHALVGKAVIASLKGDYKTSDKIIVLELVPLLKKGPSQNQLNSKARQLISETYRKNLENREESGEDISQELKDLFDPEELD
ncbi:MAG: serine/threonine protein kinase [Planctomycetes bacterium]|nr:serine/threonine protein kinase [Planctomycetota bacterium]